MWSRSSGYWPSPQSPVKQTTISSAARPLHTKSPFTIPLPPLFLLIVLFVLDHFANGQTSQMDPCLGCKERLLGRTRSMQTPFKTFFCGGCRTPTANTPLSIYAFFMLKKRQRKDQKLFTKPAKMKLSVNPPPTNYSKLKGARWSEITVDLTLEDLAGEKQLFDACDPDVNLILVAEVALSQTLKKYRAVAVGSEFQLEKLNTNSKDQSRIMVMLDTNMKLRELMDKFRPPNDNVALPLDELLGWRSTQRPLLFGLTERSDLEDATVSFRCLPALARYGYIQSALSRLSLAAREVIVRNAMNKMAALRDAGASPISDRCWTHHEDNLERLSQCVEATPGEKIAY